MLVGHGRVGSFVSEQLLKTGTPLLVIEEDVDRVDHIKGKGPETIAGNAADPDVIRAANLEAARCVLVAVPDAFEGGQIVAQARERNASLPIVARAHSEAEIEHLKKHGATRRHGRARDRQGDDRGDPAGGAAGRLGDAEAEPAGRAGLVNRQHRGDRPARFGVARSVL